MSIALYEHNQAAYDAAISLMRETGKAAVVHPTGTGKSFIGFKLAQEHPDTRICWLSPSEYIYQTQVENLKAAIRVPTTLANLANPVENIHFMTYAKLMVTHDAGIGALTPGFIVLDEFHRAGAAEWNKGVRRLLDAYPHTPVLGLSATGIRYLDNQRDMADELFDGNIASEITLGEAIVRNILLPPTYIASIYAYQKDLEKYRRQAGKAKSIAVRDAARKYLQALRRALEKTEGLDTVFEKHITHRSGKFIVFCANVEHMHEIMDHIPHWFRKVDPTPHIYTMYADDTASAKSFAAFKQDNGNRLKLLLCIDMLNEGVHVEDISGVILFRPTVSPIIYKQQIGRALSAAKSNQPVIFDVVNNFENLYSIGSVKQEMQQAIEYLREAGCEEKIINENLHIIDEVKDCKHLFNELQDCLSASWTLMYEAARRYYQAHGNLLVPKKYKTPEGYSLGAWVQTQRRVRSGLIPGILTDERAAKLDAVGMAWEGASAYNFNTSRQYAKAYYDEHGHLDIPNQYETPDGFKLGRWIGNLRTAKKLNGTRTTLTDGRIQQLEAIGMIWDRREHRFETNFAAAKAFYTACGHLNIPVGFTTPDGIALGVWIRKIRQRHESGRLDKALKKRFDAIGMVWSNRHEKHWQLCYERAAEFHTKHGHLHIPVTYTTADGIALGKWLRRHRTDPHLAPERKAKLDAIGMVWEDAWERRYRLAKAYYKAHGHINMSQTYKIEAPEGTVWLGKWLAVQRRIYRGKMKNSRPLTKEQVDKLNALGMGLYPSTTTAAATTAAKAS